MVSLLDRRHERQSREHVLAAGKALYASKSKKKSKVRHLTFKSRPEFHLGLSGYEMSGKGKHFKKVKKFGGHSMSKQDVSEYTRDKIRADYD